LFDAGIIELFGKPIFNFIYGKNVIETVINHSLGIPLPDPILKKTIINVVEDYNMEDDDDMEDDY